MKANLFQFLLVGGFILFGILGTLVFSGVINLGGGAQDQITKNVTLWGPLPGLSIQPFLDELDRENKNFRVVYVQKNPDTMRSELVEAIASGKSPDLIFITEKDILSLRDKLYIRTYEQVPAATYRATYVQEAELFLDQGGVLAEPMFVDPLVLFYNEDMLTSAGFPNPPALWNEVVSQYVPKLTKKDFDGTIKQAGIGLGVFDNVDHAKEILAALFLQVGVPIVRDAYVNNGRTTVREFKAGIDTGTFATPATAVRFFTDFSNPTKTTYTWNRTLSSSKDAFISEKLALYIGFSSELAEIKRKNVRLNVGVAELPQVDIQNAPRTTFGKTYALAIPKASQNLIGGIYVQAQMSDPTRLRWLTQLFALTPVRKDMLTSNASDPFAPILFRAALTAKSFYDPDPEVTSTIFKRLIDTVVSGRQDVFDALDAANKSIEDALK